MIIYLRKSLKTNKKLDAILPSGEIISFGDARYSDFTLHNDETRLKAYIKRHQVNEDWTDLTKAGTWSRYILWNKPTLADSIKNMQEIFNIRIGVI